MHVFTADTPAADIERAVDAGEHFWLDVARDQFDPHGPAARALDVEGRIEFPFTGAALTAGEVRRIDVTIIAAPSGLVTLSAEPHDAFADLREAAKPVDAFAVMHELAHSVVLVADHLQDEIDDAETGLLERSRRQSLARLRALRPPLSALLRISRSQRSAIHRMRDDLESLSADVGQRRLTAVDRHVATATERTETARQTAAEALNLYQSIAAEYLTKVATVFLPLTVVTGFFGMNFKWMTDHIQSLGWFLALGVGGPVVVVLVVWLYVRHAVGE